MADKNALYLIRVRNLPLPIEVPISHADQVWCLLI